MDDPIRELCSGRTPQNAILGRFRVDPVAVLGDDAEDSDKAFAVPPNVPLFTSEDGLSKLLPANAGRGHSDENMIPVVAHIPAGTTPGTLIFAGISYNSASRSRPIVTVATGGFMPIPYDETVATDRQLVRADSVWWHLPNRPYGTKHGPHIAVPAANASDKFMGAGDRALCNIKIATATPMDCAINLVPPEFA